MTHTTYNFTGQTAIVTGAAQGIGAAIATALSQAGAQVVVWDLTPTTPGHIAVDIADPASIDAALQQTLSRHAQVDILVNNAGYAGLTVPLWEYPLDEWQRIMEINLTGTFQVCKAVIPGMMAAGAGRIINIASLAGKEGTPNASAYSAAKAGIIALTKSMGKELAGSGVLVNAIAPAAVRTTLLEQMSPAHVQTMIDKSPLKRLGEPEEVAELVLWLCSAGCSFSTGAVFDLSGGRATY